MKQLVYISTAVNLMSDNDLIEILDVSRTRNTEHKVTGILLYSNGTFIQLLEGMAADVNLIYESIERDTRHKNVIKLVDERSSRRNFPQWSMGFSLVDADKSKDMIGYLNSTDEILNVDKDQKVITMLKNFILVNELEMSS